MKRKSLFFSAASSLCAALILLFLTGCPKPTEPVAPDLTAPANLTSVTTEVTESSVTFTWNNPSDDDYAYMAIYKTGDYEYSPVAEVKKSETTYTVTNLAPDTEYNFTFISVDENGNRSSGYLCNVKTKIFINPQLPSPSDLQVKQKPGKSGILVTLTWNISDSEKIEQYKINIKKGTVVTTKYSLGNNFEDELEEGEYTIEVIAIARDLSQTEPVSTTFTVSREIAEKTVLKGLTLSVDAQGLEGNGTEEKPYIIYRDVENYTEKIFEKNLKVTVTPDPQTAEMTSKVYFFNYGLNYDSEKNLITSFTDDKKASLQAYTYDESYNKISSNTVYFSIGFGFDRVTIDDDFIMAVDAKTDRYLTPKYYTGNQELPVAPLIQEDSWKSSDETVATVENGVVKALSEGKATITYTADGHSATVNVTVFNSIICPESVIFKDSQKILKVGTEYALEPVIKPEDYNVPVTFYAFKEIISSTTVPEASDSDVVSINGSTIKTEKAGDAYIYASWTKVTGTMYGQEITRYISSNYVTIKSRPENTSFNLADSKVELPFGSTYQITATPVPENSIFYDNEISFTSSNPKVIVSETGLVSCNETELQDADITVKIRDVEKTVKVRFCIPVTGITLDKNVIILGKNNEKATFTATVYPENASDKTVTWESSDSNVLSVENGTITTKSAGVVTVTAKAGNKCSTASVLVLNTSDSFTLDRSSLRQLTAEEAGTNYAGYYTDAAGKVAYSYTTAEHASATKLPGGFGKWDVIGKKGDKWLSSTYVNAGWGYAINNKIVSLNQNGTAANGNISLTVIPLIVYNKGVPFVMFVNALTNTGSVDLTGVKFGSGTDVQIAGNDNAPVNATSVGANLVDSNTEMIFALNCLSGEAVTPVDTLWIGKYSDGAMQNVYNNKRDSISNIDSAIAYSWQNIDLKAGETKLFTVRLTFVEDEGGTLDALVY